MRLSVRPPVRAPRRVAEPRLAEPATRRDSTDGGTQPRSAPTVVHDLVDEWGLGSFPASDPPANW